MAALDIYAKQEQWEKCLEVAAKQVNAFVSPQGQTWGPGTLEWVGSMESHCRGSGSTTPLYPLWPVRLSGEVLEPRSMLCLNFVINGALEEAK